MIFVINSFDTNILMLEIVSAFHFQVNCEYADWAEWGECDQACGGGSQSRTREVTRHAWYGGTKCTEDDSKEERTCNEAACPGKKLRSSKA